MREWLTRRAPVVLTIVLLAVAAIGLGTAPRMPTDRAQALEQRLRCPVCRTVSIAESPSEAANEMRRIVAAQVAAGRSDEQVIDYFQNRYGPWVVLDAPPRGQTLMLWVLVGLGGAGGLAVVGFRARTARQSPRPLSEATRKKLSAALADYRDRIDGDEEDDEP